MDAREVALITLNMCQRQGGWSDAVLKKQLASAKLDGRDAALATRLCFGVLQNEMLLDFYLTHFSNVPLKRMESKVLLALRIGAYQILFMDRIPQSAAVNQSVALVRAHAKKDRAAGLVNAILRSLIRSLDNLPPVTGETTADRLSVQYSHPKWLTEQMIAILGESEAEALLAANNEAPPMTAMVNTQKTTIEALIDMLQTQQVEATAHPWVENCIILSGTGNIEHLSAFSDGLFYIQDVASRLAIMAAGVAPSLRVLDTCAAPGGKTFTAALEMKNSGELCACDIHPHKIKLIQNGAERLGLTMIEAELADASKFSPKWQQSFDVVLVDAPCSGLGVIRKKPDIRYKDADLLLGLPAVQRAILDNASDYVKPGGVLLYSTCTVLPRENEEIIDDFLLKHDRFAREMFSLPGSIGDVPEGQITLWPHRNGTDGFFIAKLRKNAAKGNDA